MSHPCPTCDAPLTKNGGFCKECGWDADLAGADYRGEGTDLGEFDYDDFLAQEGLAKQPIAWAPLLVVLAIAAALILMVLR